jgi:hydroxyethylthiazole kinase-like uncharacterized protein yjeF
VRTLSVAEARAIDRDATERLGLPAPVLMENAARAVADEARKAGARFVVLCGPGNNGGDGLAAARHLGAACAVHLLAEPDPARAPDAALQLRILRNAGREVRVGSPPDPASGRGAVWIDALFGIGLSKPLSGAAAEWVAAFNAAEGTKIAVDVPSGLDADSGAVLSVACQADVTVTFVAPKRGMLVPAARPYVGRIVVASLGLP